MDGGSEVTVPGSLWEQTPPHYPGPKTVQAEPYLFPLQLCPGLDVEVMEKGSLAVGAVTWAFACQPGVLGLGHLVHVSLDLLCSPCVTSLREALRLIWPAAKLMVVTSCGQCFDNGRSLSHQR